MRLWLFIMAALLVPATASAQDNGVRIVNGIRIIDARQLSVADLQRLAAAERANATRAQCCDWGGMGCDPAVAREAVGPTEHALGPTPRGYSPASRLP